MSRPPKKLALAIDADLVQDNMPAEVVPKIFIGSIHAAFNQEALHEKGITHILNASRLPSTFPKMFSYLSIDIRDKDNANILSCIPASNIFIEAGVDSGGVLVHCYGGRSRSAALIAAFLMSSCGWDLAQTLQVIKAARPVASINAGFEKQLRAYAQTKYDVYLAQQVLLRGRVRALAEYRSVVEQEVSRDTFNHKSSKPLVLRGSGFGDAKASSTNTAINSETNASKGEGGDHVNGLLLDDMSGHKRCWSAGSSASKDSDAQESRDGTPRDRDDIDTIVLSQGNCAGSSSATPRASSYNSLARAAATNMVAGLTQEISESRSLKMRAVPVNPARQAPSVRPRGGSTSSGSKLRRHIPLVDSKSPNIRLSRPGTGSVRVIPPLRGLEKLYSCSWCGFSLFNLGNVLRIDLDLQAMECLSPSSLERAECKSPETSKSQDKEDDEAKFPAPNKFNRASHRAMLEFSVPEGSPRWHPNGSHGNHNEEMKEFGHHAPPMSTRHRGSNTRAFDFDFKNDYGGGDGIPMSVRGKNKGFGFDRVSLDSPTGASNEVDSPMSIAGENDEMPSTLGSTWGYSAASSPTRPSIVPSLINSEAASGVKIHLIHDTASLDSLDSKEVSPNSGSTPRLPSSGGIRSSPLVASNSSSIPSIDPFRPNMFRQGSGARLSGSSATAAAQVEFSFESPRIALPPHFPQHPEGGWSPMDRPQSAEKKRWLARANLLREGDSKVAKMAQEDDEASRLVFGREKYIYLEYLEWMGEEMFKPSVNECEIKCGQCKKVIGGCCWTPQPTQTFGGRLEAPLIKIHKSVVQEMDLVLDATPRVDDNMDLGDENGSPTGSRMYSEFK